MIAPFTFTQQTKNGSTHVGAPTIFTIAALVASAALLAGNQAHAGGGNFMSIKDAVGTVPHSTRMTNSSRMRPSYTPQISSKVGRARITKRGNLYISWRGRIRPGMANFIRKAFAEMGEQTRHVYFKIHSPGGKVKEGERVIRVLRMIKKSHRLTTVVGRGSKCASMCVPIYLQGDKRLGARASVWLFHDVSRKINGGGRVLRRKATLRLLRTYFAKAGVSKSWLRAMYSDMKNADIWRAGQELIVAKTGIITHPMSNRRMRRWKYES